MEHEENKQTRVTRKKRNGLSPTQRIAILAVFTALTAVFLPIPFVFLLPIALAAVWFDTATTFILGLLLGVLSYCMSFIVPSPISIAFIQYPYIAIVPRMLVGVSAHGVYKLIARATKDCDHLFLKYVLPAALCGLTAAAVNTGGVLGLFALCAYHAVIENTAMAVLLGTWAISGCIEAAVVTVLTPCIDAAGRKVLIRTGLKSGR